MTDDHPSQPSAGKDGDPSSLFARLKRLFTGRGNEGSLRESLEEVLDEHVAEGDERLGVEERSLLLNTLSFAEMRVDDIMVPRADIIAVEEHMPFRALVHAFTEAEVSRMPVYRGALDDVVAMVHVKDVFRIVAGARGPNGRLRSFKDVKIAEIQREILFVPASMRLADLLVKMRATRIHMAAVIDEYGGTEGIVTIEDLVEQIVGEIEDEHDIEEPEGNDTLTAIDATTYEAGARLSIEDLERALGRRLGSDDHEDVDSVGGLVVSLVGRVPQRGEVIAHQAGLLFEVLDADPRRLKKVRISLSESPVDG